MGRFIRILISTIVCISVLISPTSYSVSASLRPTMEVHFLDVGQADCIFIQTSNNKTMLIDAGDDHDGQRVKKFLERKGIEKIDILVATHPHHDHIGGMDTILASFDVQTILMPNLHYHTKYYKELMRMVEQKKPKKVLAKEGVNLSLDWGIRIDVLAPPLKSQYKYINDYSAVLKLTHGTNTFLFAADAGIASEKQMLRRYPTLNADVLKVAHHGANTGTTAAFIDRVDPEYAVISVGRQNDYDYPSKKVLKRLKEKQIKVYRTDQSGTAIAFSDGKKIQFTTLGKS
jgi:competence protein ComEC